MKKGYYPHMDYMDPLDITHGACVVIKPNFHVGQLFMTGKEPRQRDPLSPFLFNLVVDVLTNMLSKAAFLSWSCASVPLYDPSCVCAYNMEITP